MHSHRIIPMHAGKTGKFDLRKNPQSNVFAILDHGPHVQMNTAAIQMYNSNILASVGIIVMKKCFQMIAAINFKNFCIRFDDVALTFILPGAGI